MSDLKDAILDAKYIDMIGLADFIVRDCALPDVDADGNLVSGQQEIAAAIFRWAVTQRDAGQSEVPTARPQSSNAPSEAAAPVKDFTPKQVNDQQG